jgi:hypothetical protein
MFKRAAQSFLPDRDYLPVALPTEDVSVFQVLTRTGGGDLSRYSTLDKILEVPPGTTRPHVERDQAVVNTSGSTHQTATLGLGLNVVSSIIQALGGDAGLNIRAENANGVRYSYSKVVSDRVDLASLDDWLGVADMRLGLRNAAGLLAAGQIFVVVGVLRAKALEVELTRDGKVGVDLEVKAVQDIVGGTVTVSADSKRSSRLTFTGKTTLTVAAKAARLNLAPDGIWINERMRSKGLIRSLRDYTFLTDELRLV